MTIIVRLDSMLVILYPGDKECCHPRWKTGLTLYGVPSTIRSLIRRLRMAKILSLGSEDLAVYDARKTVRNGIDLDS